MFMRRGCMLGCVGWLIACVAIGLLGWFVVIPRFSDALEEGVADGISTMIADEINPQYSRSDLQQGANVRFSFETINNTLRDSGGSDAVDGITVTSSGNRIIIQADLNNQAYEFAFLPDVSDDGGFMLTPVDDGGWWQRQITGILAGGFENSINDWLDRNDLRLTDVTLEGDTIVFSVTGK